VIRAFGRLGLAAVACAWAWMLYQLSRWLIVADRGVALETRVEVTLAPLRPVSDDDGEDDGMSPWRRGMDGDG